MTKEIKTDKLIHALCIAEIKRSTFKPYAAYKWSKFYEANTDFPHRGLGLKLMNTELIISSTIIDSDNYSILTTQRLITNENGVKSSGGMIGAEIKTHGAFKAQETDFTLCVIRLGDGTDLKCFIETGKASMIMIHGLRTLIRTQSMTVKQIKRVTQLRNRQYVE